MHKTIHTHIAENGQTALMTRQRLFNEPTVRILDAPNPEFKPFIRLGLSPGSLVEPGYGPTTRFTSNTGPRMEGLIPEAYAPFAQRIFASLAPGPAAVTSESDVAAAVWRAANDATGQLRFPAGADAVALAQSR